MTYRTGLTSDVARSTPQIYPGPDSEHSRLRERALARAASTLSAREPDPWTVLPRATTRVRERVQTSASAVPRREWKRLQIVENAPTIANRSRSGCQFDKLGSLVRAQYRPSPFCRSKAGPLRGP